MIGGDQFIGMSTVDSIVTKDKYYKLLVSAINYVHNAVHFHQITS